MSAAQDRDDTMIFALDAEQDLLRRTVAAFLDERCGLREARRFSESGGGYDLELYRSLAGELGLAGLAVPERFGGSGASTVELALVFEELGARVVPSPLFATVALGITALLVSGDESAMAEHLPDLASGKRTATLAHAEGANATGGAVRTRASRAGDGWVLDGVKTHVPDGATADAVVVSAHDGDTTDLYVVGADDPGVERTARRTLDTTRPLATLSFARTPARRLSGSASGPTTAVAGVLLAAELVGVAAASLDMALAHAKSRVQFGRAIGSFQAIKHKLADMYVDVEGARAAVRYAGRMTASTNGPEFDATAALTSAHVADAAIRVTSQTLQILGGIGYTWEHDAHFLFTRARAAATLLDSPDTGRERSLSLLEL